MQLIIRSVFGKRTKHCFFIIILGTHLERHARSRKLHVQTVPINAMTTCAQQLIAVISSLFPDDYWITTEATTMEPSAILILLAIVLLGICTLGGGTMAFCCFGWERGLPFLSIRELYDELSELDRRTTDRYKRFVSLVNVVTADLREQAATLPDQIMLKEVSTFSDMVEEKKTSSVGCQSTPSQPITVMVAPATTDVVISIPEE